MTIQQNGDVKLIQTNNNGDFDVVNGLIEMDGGLQTTVYLALFGGNLDDDKSDQNKFNWWGNIGETEKSKQYRSETQYLVQALPATSSNLKRIEDAIQRDLNFLLTEKIATSFDVNVTIPQVKWLQIDILVNAEGDESEFTFFANWQLDANLNIIFPEPKPFPPIEIPTLIGCASSWVMQTHPLKLGYDIKFTEDIDNQLYIGAGTAPATVAYSNDGIIFTNGVLSYAVHPSSVARKLAYSPDHGTGQGVWVVVGWNATFNDHYIERSLDGGKTWTQSTYGSIGAAQGHIDIIYNNGRFIVCSYNTQYILISDNGALSFTPVLIDGAIARNYTSLSAEPGTNNLLLGQSTGAIRLSTDNGNSWTTKGNAYTGHQSLVYDSFTGFWIAVGSDRIETSSDYGLTWIQRYDSIADNNLYIIKTNQLGCIYAAGVNGEVVKSNNAIDWVIEAVGISDDVFAFSFSYNKISVMGLVEYYTGGA